MTDIGPRYGVRAYFRNLRDMTRDLSGPASADWFERACAATRRPMTPATIRGMIDDHERIILDHGGFGFIESWSTVLGKPSCHSTGYIPIAVRIRNHPSDGGAPYDEDVVLVRRLDLEISQGKIVYSMASAHLAITRHALERLYERGGCRHETFAETVRDELLRTLCGLAIAAAAEIGCIRPGSPADYHHQAIPFGYGLMVLDGRLFADWNTYGPERVPLAQNHLIKNGKSLRRRPLLSRFNSMTLTHPELGSENVWASRVFTTRTYVDRGDMTRAKMSYYDAFSRLLEEYDLQPLLQAYFRPRPHEDASPLEVDLPGPALDLLVTLQEEAQELFNADRAIPVCSVREQVGEIWDQVENRPDLAYGKGKAGPMGRNVIEIADVTHLGKGASAYARGTAVLRDPHQGPCDVSFMVQGGNYATLRGRLVPGASLDVPVRWTGPRTVTIVDDAALVRYRQGRLSTRAA